MTASNHPDTQPPRAAVDPGRWAVRNYKQVLGRDGYAFEASIYLDGARVGQVFNSGTGGTNDYRGFDPATFKALQAHAERQPDLVFNGTPLKIDADLFVEELINRAQLAAKIARAARKSTVFTTAGDDPAASFRTLNLPFTPENEARIRTFLDGKFGAGRYTILNEKVDVAPGRRAARRP